MKKNLLIICCCYLTMFLIACGQKSIEGIYESKGGKVGIYEMSTMTVQKTFDGSKYKITFAGVERTITFDNVEYQDSELKINDKGFLMPIKFNGLKAIVQQGGAVFEKIDNPISQVSQSPKITESAPSQNTKTVYPETLIGLWARDNGDKSCADAIEAEKQAGMWDGLDIQKNELHGMELICLPTKLVNANGSFIIDEDCEENGEKYKITEAIYSINSKNLQVLYDDGNGKKIQSNYRFCK